PGVRGPARRDPSRRRQSLPRRTAAAGGDRAQAGRGPPDPHRDRPRRAGALRSAAAGQELRQAVPGVAAAVPEDARGGRRGGVLRARRRHRRGRRAPGAPLTGWGLPQLTSSYPARYGRAGLVSEQVDPMGGPTAITLADTSTLDQCPALPPQGQGAEENAQWWSGLSAAEQDYFIAANPQIGGMDGLPAEVRHEANMATLRNDAASGHDQAGAQALLDRIESSQGGPAGERIFLLDYEPPGRDGNPDAKV